MEPQILFRARNGRCAPLSEREQLQIRNLASTNEKLTGRGIKAILGLPHSPKTITNYLASLREPQPVQGPEPEAPQKPPFESSLSEILDGVAERERAASTDRAERFCRAALTGIMANVDFAKDHPETVARICWDMGWACEEEYRRRLVAHHRAAPSSAPEPLPPSHPYPEAAQ